jgi:hypothetical protein
MMMPKFSSSRWLRQPTLHLLATGLVTITLPAAPAQAGLFDWIGRSGNDYKSCAKDLANAKIATDAASDACAKALHPQHLAKCVTRTSTAKDVKVTAVEALDTCKQVRRPLELATCVVDIRQMTKDAAVVDVLDTCRRSLLPLSFSKCVVGLHQELKLAAKPSMDACIDANFPRDFVSKLLPLDYAPPALPSSFNNPPNSQPDGFTPNTAPLPNIPATPPNDTPTKGIRGLGG